jgi:hypothetical protein
MQSGEFVDSYRFSDVVRLWARERLVHELNVARELVEAVVVDGLRFQSVDPQWMDASESFRGCPYVGFLAIEGAGPIVIRVVALEHLLAVMRGTSEPSPQLLFQEFVTRADCRDWLMRTRRSLPAFWFGDGSTSCRV